jgi:hypothetical protein
MQCLSRLYNFKTKAVYSFPFVNKTTAPVSASVSEEACLEDGVVGVGDHLGASVGGIGCGGKFNGVIRLIEEKFNWLGRIVGRFHASVIVNEIGGRDAAVAIVEMAENGKCGHVCVARDAVAKGAVVNVIDGGEKLLLESFVG